MNNTAKAASAGSAVILAVAGMYNFVHVRSVQPLAPFAITTTSLPDAICGQPYRVVLQATGGIKPYAWGVMAGSSPLPDWLTLETVNDEGVLSGTAPAPGLDGTCGGPVQLAGMTIRTRSQGTP